MNVKSETRNIIKKDSRYSIKTEGLLGDKYVEISFGSAKAYPIGEDRTIANEMQRDITEQAQALADDARSQLTRSATTWKPSSTTLPSWFFERRGYSETAELTQHAIPRIPARKSSKEFQFDAKEVFDKPDNAKLKSREPSRRPESFSKTTRLVLPSSPRLRAKAILKSSAC